MNQDIVLSINPLYRCNFRCSFCYLTPEQLADKAVLDLDVLSSRLSELLKYRRISHVDLYGGEITLLDDAYSDKMFAVIKKFYQGPVNLVTNLSRVGKVCLRDDVILSVSWDDELRQDHHRVLSNIISLDREVHLLMLASPKMLQWSDEKLDEVISLLNSLSNITSVEIKPYSSNQSNSYNTSNRAFEEFIIRWLMRKDRFVFSFTNERNILNSLAGTANSWSDDHLYITPEGKFAVLEFDEKFHEYFLSLEKFEDYLNWCGLEKTRIRHNLRCSSCDYLGTCLSEHLKNQLDPSDSCDGFKGLLEWYKSNMAWERGELHGSSR
ncbi:MAG: hypothetical protein ACLGHN_11950 [Bacteriovoracia bacterium]